MAATGEAPVGFAYYTSRHGLRVELVDAARRRQFREWFAGGELAVATEPTPRPSRSS